MIAVEKNRMTLAEFRALPESNLPTELIDGELIMSPSPIDLHQGIVGDTYSLLKAIVKSGDVKFAPLDVYLGKDVVQPDVFWVSGEDSLCKLGEDGYWYGAPDLAVEVVSPSSIHRDHHTKYLLYERHGVREYWIIDPVATVIHVFTRKDQQFELVGIFEQGDTFKSPLLDADILVDKLFA